jgi:DNA polymerase-3 subunit alpha
MQGLLSKKAVLEKGREEELSLQENAAADASSIEVAEEDITEIISDEVGDGEEEVVEESTKKAEPKGSFNFLNLDEVDAYKEKAFATEQPELFEEKKDWKQKMKDKENGKEYTVAGLITEYRVQDGFRSGEKVAFVTLEDYSGSYSFRLGDRDYMKLKEKLEVQRFVILKIKFAKVKDGRIFVNVNEVIELQEAFDKFAKSLSLVMDVMDFRKEDLEFFQNVMSQYAGDQKLRFFIKNSEDNQEVEIQSIRFSVDLNGDFLNEVALLNKYEFYLN